MEGILERERVHSIIRDFKNTMAEGPPTPTISETATDELGAPELRGSGVADHSGARAMLDKMDHNSGRPSVLPPQETEAGPGVSPTTTKQEVPPTTQPVPPQPSPPTTQHPSPPVPADLLRPSPPPLAPTRPTPAAPTTTQHSSPPTTKSASSSLGRAAELFDDQTADRATSTTSLERAAPKNPETHRATSTTSLERATAQIAVAQERAEVAVPQHDATTLQKPGRIDPWVRVLEVQEEKQVLHDSLTHQLDKLAAENERLKRDLLRGGCLRVPSSRILCTFCVLASSTTGGLMLGRWE